ncbi:TPA: trp operon leader peptide [Escherichia coli]|nr:MULTISPECIES: trp operon leader peptide [unclassified Escherichia]EFB8680450.1 trp operon leader peptide [Escherichia coli]ELG9290531.1 trp operon leader peptide [Shigella flexneri]ELS4397762.1 trp operon leader peptide [Shigella sonnei]EFH2585626.1 trp operon leader peptide [Escherichia coli]EFS2926116.1 trp operon leader peptide [Escherichia coli]
MKAIFVLKGWWCTS